MYKFKTRMEASPMLRRSFDKLRKSWQRQRRAPGLLLALTCLLGFSPQTFAQSIDYTKPEIVAKTNLTPTLNGQSHVTFDFIWFNKANSNAFFDCSTNDVYLYIDDAKILNLSELAAEQHPEFTCNMFNAKRADSKWNAAEKNASDLVNDHKNKVLYTATFTGKQFRTGTVVISNPSYVTGHSDAMKATLDICLEELHHGMTHDVRIVGDWVVNAQPPSSPCNTYATTPCKVTIAAPSASYSQDPVIKRSGSRKASYTVSGMSAHSHQATGSSTTSGFYYTIAAWDAEPADLHRGGDYWGWSSLPGKANRLLWTDLKDGSASKTYELALPSDYTPQTIYPRVRITSEPYYEMNVSGTLVSQMVSYNHDYPAVTLPGYARPKNVTVTSDMWTREVKISWEPEVSSTDSKLYDTEGKWLIYRKKTGQPTTQELYGETSYNTYTPDKRIEYSGARLLDLPDYDQGYTYDIVFQPKAWNLGADRVGNQDDVPDLTAFARHTIMRTNPLKTITASTDRSDGTIAVNWTFNSFGDATPTNKYIINIYRREKAVGGAPENEWESKPVHQQEVTSKNISAGSFENTGIKNARTTYEYKAEVEAMGKTYVTNSFAEGRLDGSTKVLSVTASRGDYSGVVRLNWTVKQVGSEITYFTVRRRLLGSNASYQEIYTTSGVATSYSYEDVTAQPGCYYQYKVDCYNVEDGVTYPGTGESTDGFALAQGVVNGRVSYGSGTAVKDVKVSLVNTSAGESPQSQFRSMKFGEPGSGAGVVWEADAEKVSNLLLGKSWTIQMNVYPDASKMNIDEKVYTVLDSRNTATISLVYDEDSNTYDVQTNLAKNEITVHTALPANEWSNITVAVDAVTGQCHVGVVYPDGTTGYWSDDYQQGGLATSSGTKIVIGNYERLNSATSFCGNIDEFRFFTRVLTEDDIKKNYDHRLSGSEDGLAIYYPMDEGITNQMYVYDYSRTGGVSNGRHATLSVNTESDINVPSADQFSICAYTDKNGNYSVSGIPFSGDGTSYSIIPTMGTHQFSPSETSRFVSAQSLVHNGVDFTDISSFPVRGKVVFKDTTFPVSDATLYIDGLVASRDGAAVVTNSEGEFEVDVPIGSHYITVKKQGHTFQAEGRFPADPDGVGTRYTFEEAMNNLTFYDTTLVPVAGRVVGGDIEDAYPLGFGLSTANIGQATIVLQPEGNHLMNATDDGAAASAERELATNIIARTGTATVGAANASDPESPKTITITTNAKTGEFAALMPPLKYNVKSIRTASYTFPSDNLPVIDATNPLVVYTDSIEKTAEGGKTVYEYFEYVASMKKRYKSQPVLEIAGNNPDGSFGDAKVAVEDQFTGIIDSIPAITLREPLAGSGQAFDYRFGAPVFRQLRDYTFALKGYERYENRDVPDAPVSDLVPLKDVEVVFQNEFAITTGVNPDDPSMVNIAEDGVVTLDNDGLGHYTFQVGLPNILPPYQRNLTATYVVDGQTYTWKDAPWTLSAQGAGRGAFNAIVLGQMPSGNDFMTAGPDRVQMILRDPAGSGSYASWSEGHTKTKVKKVAYNTTSENELRVTTHLGSETAIAEGIGFMTIQNMTSQIDVNTGVDVNITVNYDETYTDVTTTTQTITTSDAADYVGADGDVFVGSATNIIFGDSRTVCVVKEDGDYHLDMQDLITMGQRFGTSFIYTQRHIEDVLLPTFREQRNALLTHVSALDNGRANRPAAGREPRYETLLDADDPRFGQPDTYIMIEPADYAKKVYEDRVNWYNLQIAAWTRILADNERVKVEAISNRDEYLKDNYSFDGGGGVRETVETSHSRQWNTEVLEQLKLSVGAETGFRICGLGLTASVKTTDGEEFGQTHGGTVETSTTFDFSLAESGSDYLSVDVFDAPDGFGPIFSTRGGATSCPYEDEIVTKYYNPGAVISAKTVQVEQPEITAVDFASITGVPSGKDAEMAVQLRNLSQTKTGAYYNISIDDTTNPDGLQVIMDGYNVTNGRTIYIDADEKGVNKKFYFRQSNTAVTDYKNVVLRLSSVCEPDAIYSDLPVSITFQPAGSDIELAASESVVNTYTQAPLRLSMRGYDINARALESVRLQYKGLNDAQWLTLKEYVKDGDPRLASDPNLGTLIAIEGTRTLDYELDLRDALYTDQTYVFRAQTVCAAAGSYVYGESQTLQVVRDMHRPQLMGNASPSDGVLNAGDEISIVFNEDVRTGELGKAENFSVRGILNGSQLTHDAALQLTADGEGAKTSSTIDLAGRSFSLGTWMRYTAAGHIFQHGSAATGLDVSVNASNQLVVSLAGQTLTSTETLRPDTWLYLSVAYDNDAKTVSANYAYDSNSVALLHHKTVSETANGSESAALVIGRGLTGSMHELTLWDTAKTWEEVLSSIYTTKDRTTRGLLGYWRLDEGHGTVATDYSRSRHLEVPAANAWYIAQANHALVLDGTAVAQLPVTEVLKATDDYMLEGWFMADKANSAASIFSFAQQALDVRLNAAGRMEVATEAGATLVGTTDYRDGQWHHVALNVLRSENGRTTVYVDGEALKQVFAVPALQTSHIFVGGSTGSTAKLKGGIDEVRVWRGTRTAETIKQSANHRLNGADEPALMMYYPFEESTVDAYQQTVVQPTMADKSKLGADHVLQYYVGTVSTSATAAPSLKAAPRVENIPFTFVADERRIVINLDVEPARLEGSNVEITVHSVSDKNGNYCLPITWTAFVQQNQLTWADDAVELTKKAGEPVAFDAVIVNQSGNVESWTLSGLPTWLSASADNGSLQPLGQKTIHFTVDEGVAIGSHEAVVYLTGSMDIDAPLVVSLTNLGNVPEWSVNPADYEYTMNIYGQLHFNGVPSKDKNDLVAAFRGTECVGVAQPVYKSRYDEYFVLMNVYGNTADEGEPLKYKVYDASTGQIFPIVIADDHRADRFVPDAVVGTMANPYIWNATDCIEQNLALKAGWQWISFYVNPRTSNASDLMAEVEDDVNIMVSENLSYTPITNTIRKVDPAVMYKLNMQQAAALDVVGTAVKMDETPVSIKSGWNWIGYPANGVISLDDAFADLAPENGDMVKSQTGFATWEEYEWVGSLGALQGGEGYQYLSGRAATRTFHYPAVTASTASRKAPQKSAALSAQAEIASGYASNMNVIALVTRGGEPVECQLSVMDSEGRLRAVSEQAVRDGRHFVTIAGSVNGDALKFVATVDGFQYIVPGTLYFAPDAVIGSLKVPFTIDLDSPTGIGTLRIDGADDNMYDLSGRLLPTFDGKTKAGIVVISADGKKTFLK